MVARKLWVRRMKTPPPPPAPPPPQPPKRLPSPPRAPPRPERCKAAQTDGGPDRRTLADGEAQTERRGEARLGMRLRALPPLKRDRAVETDPPAARRAREAQTAERSGRNRKVQAAPETSDADVQAVGGAGRPPAADAESQTPGTAVAESGAQTHAPAVATAAALTDSLVRADAGCGAPARAPPGSLATQTHPGSEAAAQTDVSRAAKAAPGRDEGAQTFGVG